MLDRRQRVSEQGQASDPTDFAGAWMILQKRREQRAKYLNALYLLVGGSPLQTADHHEIAEQAGLSEEWARIAFYDLRSEGLLEAPRPVGVVSITPQGVRLYEGGTARERMQPCGFGVNPGPGSTLHDNSAMHKSVFLFGSSADCFTPAEVTWSPTFTSPLLGTEVDSPLPRDENPAPRWERLRVWLEGALQGPLADSLLKTAVRFLLSKLERWI